MFVGLWLNFEDISQKTDRSFQENVLREMGRR